MTIWGQMWKSLLRTSGCGKRRALYKWQFQKHPVKVTRQNYRTLSLKSYLNFTTSYDNIQKCFFADFFTGSHHLKGKRLNTFRQQTKPSPNQGIFILHPNSFLPKQCFWENTTMSNLPPVFWNATIHQISKKIWYFNMCYICGGVSHKEFWVHWKGAFRAELWFPEQ